MTRDEETTPSRRSTSLLIGLILCGIGIAAVAVGVIIIAISINRVPERIDARPNVPVPGSENLRLEQGIRGLWLEVTAPSRPDLRDIGVTITPADGGESLPIAFPQSVENYDVKGRRGALIGTVTIPKTGEYLVVVEGRGGDRIGIGESTTTSDFFDLGPPFISLALGFISLSTGIGMLILTTLRRRRERWRRQRQANSGAMSRKRVRP